MTVPHRLGAAAEPLVVVLLLIASIWYGRVAFLHPAATPDYYYLGPAAMLASGQGFQAPAPGVSPFAEFLSRSIDRVTAEQLHGAAVRPLDQFDYSARYLLSVVGYWWRAIDISWARAADIAGLFHALAVVGLYATLRLFVTMPWAAAGALWLCTSTLQLSLVPHLRDYSKGAFIIATVPLLLLLSLRATDRRVLWSVAAAAGAVIGVGLGFKRDVFVMVPLGVAFIVIFRDRRPWTGLAGKVQAAVVFVAAFLAASAPVLVPLVGGGSHTMHVTLLGFARDFDRALEIEPAAHGLVPFYNDAYVGMMVRAYEQNFSAATFDIPSPGYDRAGERLWLAILRAFPADMAARVLASANQILNLVFLNPDPTVVTAPLPGSGTLTAVYTWLHRWNGTGWLLGVLVIAVAAVRDLRHALCAAALILALAGYPALQFMPRHYLYLQVIPIAAIVVLMSRLVALRSAAGDWREAASRVFTLISPSSPRREGAKRVAVALLWLAAIVVGPLMALRPLQQAGMTRALAQWIDGPRTPLQPELIEQASGDTLLHWPTPAGITLHYATEFAADPDGEPILLGLRYRAPASGTDYSRVLAVASSSEPVRVGFAAIHDPDVAEFLGIELGPRALARLQGVYRVESGGPYKMPLDLRLPGDWDDRRLYQRLSLEGRDSRAVPVLEVVCATLPGCHGQLGNTERSWASQSTAWPDTIDRIHAPIVTVTAGGIAVDDLVENDSSYLFQLREHSIAGPGAFVMHGVLDRGGVAVGLLRDGLWYKPVLIRTPGAFTVVIPIDQAGVYTPLVTNAMAPGQRRNTLRITKAGFFDGD